MKKSNLFLLTFAIIIFSNCSTISYEKLCGNETIKINKKMYKDIDMSCFDEINFNDSNKIKLNEYEEIR